VAILKGGHREKQATPILCRGEGKKIVKKLKGKNHAPCAANRKAGLWSRVAGGGEIPLLW